MPRNLLLYGGAIIVGFLVFGVLRVALGGEIVTILSLLALVVVGVVMVRNLQTNRNVAEATPAQRTEALAFAPVPGKTVIYVFRNQFVGRAVGVNVLVDGREVAQIKSPRFTRLLLNPGAHRLSGFTGANKKPGETEGLAINVNDGEVLAFKCEVEPQMVGVTVKFTPIMLPAAHAELQKITRMVLPDVAEV